MWLFLVSLFVSGIFMLSKIVRSLKCKEFLFIVLKILVEDFLLTFVFF
jgi:hypothetical protein